jgi:hypothetical protein
MNLRAAACLLGLLFVGPPAALAASFTLGAEQRSDAIRVGARSVTQDSFDAEWRVATPSGDSVTVLTPFHRIVIAARQAAFKNEPLKADELEKLLKSQQDRLVILAQLRGAREDFTRFYAPRLVAGGVEIAPAFVQNERTAVRTEAGTYLARCTYRFPTKDLTASSRVLLVIRDADGRDVSSFTIDLASMR